MYGMVWYGICVLYGIHGMVCMVCKFYMGAYYGMYGMYVTHPHGGIVAPLERHINFESTAPAT